MDGEGDDEERAEQVSASKSRGGELKSELELFLNSFVLASRGRV